MREKIIKIVMQVEMGTLTFEDATKQVLDLFSVNNRYLYSIDSERDRKSISANNGDEQGQIKAEGFCDGLDFAEDLFKRYYGC